MINLWQNNAAALPACCGVFSFLCVLTDCKIIVAVLSVFTNEHVLHSCFQSIYAMILTQTRSTHMLVSGSKRCAFIVETDLTSVRVCVCLCVCEWSRWNCFCSPLPLGQRSDGRSNGMTACHLSRYPAPHAFTLQLCGSVWICVCLCVCVWERERERVCERERKHVCVWVCVACFFSFLYLCPLFSEW